MSENTNETEAQHFCRINKEIQKVTDKIYERIKDLIEDDFVIGLQALIEMGTIARVNLCELKKMKNAHEAMREIMGIMKSVHAEEEAEAAKSTTKSYTEH